MAARKGRAPRSPQNPGAAAAVRPTLQSSAAFSAATGDCAAKGGFPANRGDANRAARVLLKRSACPRQKATLVRMRGGRAAEQTEAWRRIAKVTRYKGGSPSAAFVPFSLSALPRNSPLFPLPPRHLLRQTVPCTPFLHVGKAATCRSANNATQPQYKGGSPLTAFTPFFLARFPAKQSTFPPSATALVLPNGSTHTISSRRQGRDMPHYK